MEIKTAGRTDINDFFEKSDIRYLKKLNHTPALVFVTDKKTVSVLIISKPDELLFYPDDTKVMMQWAGQWRSDFFQFTVGDYRKYLEDSIA